MMWTTRQRSDIRGHPAIVEGPGSPVLLLHGVGLRAEAWAAQTEALSKHARVVAPDMPGHGESLAAKAPLRFSDYSEAAETVLMSLGSPAVVIGHSMGAMIALALAAKLPGQVTAVAALNAVFERSRNAAAEVRDRAETLDGRTPVDPSGTLERWFGDASSPERQACRTWLSMVDPAAYKMAYNAFATSQTPDRDMLAKVQCPALFITGSEEPNSTPSMSRAMAESAPNGRAEIVAGAAHMMPMTHAAQVNAALLDLINETGI